MMPRRTTTRETHKQRLEARIDRMRARVLILVKPGKFRPATRAEWKRMAIDYTAREQERGQPVLRECHAKELRGAYQVHREETDEEGKLYILTTVELASLAAYPALLRTGRKPTAAEKALFRADAAVLAVGAPVKVRGRLFSGRRLAEGRVGRPYFVLSLPERGRWCTIGLLGPRGQPPRQQFRVHMWDVVPQEYLDPPRRTRI